MWSRLGKAVIKPSNGSLKPLIQGTLIKQIAPVAPSIAIRSISISAPKKLANDVTTPNKAKPVTTTKTTASKKEASLIETLEEFKVTGNLKGAIRAVQNAKEKGIATPAVYLYLVDMLRDLPFDVQECATVVNWFYSDSSRLPLEVVENIDVWKSVLKLGFRFGNTYRAEDLRALVDRFTEIFDLTTLNDQTAWELLMRAYGIMNRTDAISACMTKNEENKDQASLYASAALSYAATRSNENVEKIVEKLKEDKSLTPHLLLKLIRCYGFHGDIAQTSKYIDLCNASFPETKTDKTMLLIAHKVALEHMCKDLEHTRGSRGLKLKPVQYQDLDELHTSWFTLTQDMFVGDKVVDITDCNVVLEYLTTANRIDPVQFPMSMAEEIFETYMPANKIKPNDASHRIMLNGYAKTQEYNNPESNVRLNKTLEVISKMQVAGIDTLNHPTFHALFRACIPHRDGNYQYDNFRLNSLLPPRPAEHNKFKLDPRLFEIEKIMLEAHLPHDRYTFSTLLTCLAAGGKNQAFRSRWRSLKVHGLRRDIGLYRAAFALSSLDPAQARRAMTVIKSEMDREIPKHRVDWGTYTAMLDCCIAAQLPEEAQQIMQTMRSEAELTYKNKTHADELAKWPYLDSPDFYLPMLRASIAIKGLNTAADKILNELDSKNVVYSQGIWEAKLSKLALENDGEGIRQLFNKYTMSRFEKEGKIPVPVREKTSPVVPFPTAPYSKLDMQFIDVYICSLLDNQNISLVFDVLHTLNEQTNEINLSRKSLQGIVRLAKLEKSKDELKWLAETILPKISNQNKAIRGLAKNIDYSISK